MNWSQYIEQDLRERLSSGQPLPCEPTLERLAVHYRVSTRPVRTALHQLRQEGLLEKRGAGARIGINSRSAKGKDHIDPSSRKAEHRDQKSSNRKKAQGKHPPVDPPMDYVEAIGRHLVAQSLEGRETFVREQAMAGQFAVSTTTVREVFHRLAGQGVIEHIPRRGWRLRPFLQKDMDDFAAVRLTLECMALRLSWQKLQSAEGRSAMETYLAGNVVLADPTEPPRVDDGFHAWIIEASRNRYIRDFFANFGRYYRFLFSWEGMDRASGIETVHQHRRILQAILAGDLPESQTALEAHLLRQHPVLKQVMEFNQRESSL
ncbi:MAG: GntR family transcriptional regulator [Phycisphaerales bacterium]|nr:GntR family transcriptional regulator [Phycisphaerales bacterium]